MRFVPATVQAASSIDSTARAPAQARNGLLVTTTTATNSAMRLSIASALLGALTLLPSALAVFADDAYVVDYHHQLLGVPQPHTTFFHRPRREDKASLLYTLSEEGVLGAVNPGTGAIVWRQFLARDANATAAQKGFLRAAEGENTVVSAIAGSVQAWDAVSGRERWSAGFEGDVRDLEVLAAVGGEDVQDVLVLFEGQGHGVVRRLSGKTGDVVWEYVQEVADVPVQVSTNARSVFVVSLHGTWGGYNVKVVTLDMVSGEKLEEHVLAAKSDVHAPQDVLFVGANSAMPIIAWTDKEFNALKVNILGTKQVQSLPLSGEGIQAVVVHAPHLIQSQPHFLVHSRSATHHWAEVYHIDLVAGTIADAYRLPALPGPGAFSTSSQDANVFFTRNTNDDVVLLSSKSHAVLGRWPLSGEGADISAVHSVSEVVPKSGDSYAVRSAVVTSDDDWVLVRNGAVGWSRTEGLAGAVAAAWAELPEPVTIAKELEVEAHSNVLEAYVHRVIRHANDLQHLPAYLEKLPQRFLGSFYPIDGSASTTLVGDSFGFRKLIIIATGSGRLFALDSANQGKIVWSRKAFKLNNGEKWDVKGIYVDNVKGLATITGAEGEYIIIRTDTGDVIKTVARGSLPVVTGTALVESASGPLTLPIGQDGLPGSLPKFQAPKTGLVVRGKNGEVKGLKFDIKDDEAVPAVVWTFQPNAGQRIVDVVARPLHDPVASIGRVLGDRSVMYKYLNPNTILITAVTDTASTATFYLLDTVSGEILYSTTQEGVDTTQPITTLLTENWFAYSLFASNPSTSTSTSTSSASAFPASQGYQLVIAELFESSLPNDRGDLGSASNYSSLHPSSSANDAFYGPHVESRTFLIPESISHMAVTQTRQGITSRQLICTLASSNAIIGIPRNFLDARRPVGRDPVASEMEEGLIKYMPVIDFDPKWYITHTREVMGIKNVITTPALLESTSLLFAYGVDVFGTRVAPSLAFDILGKGFGKLNLVGTVLALGAGVGVLAPMVCYIPLLLVLGVHSVLIQASRSGESRLMHDGRRRSMCRFLRCIV